MFEGFLQVEDTIAASAMIIARHIVTGLLGVPEPPPLSGSVVGKLSFSEEESVLIATIPPFASIEAVTKQIEEASRKHYGRGGRSRWPGSFRETLWLRHCALEFPARGLPFAGVREPLPLGSGERAGERAKWPPACDPVGTAAWSA